MIYEAAGSIFDSPAWALVAPVNCVGVMGKGLALEFKRRFPGLEQIYGHMCQSRELQLGRCGYSLGREGPPHVILFPTKGNWRRPSRLSYIYAGLGGLALILEARPQFDSVALPALGCGEGGLPWPSVRPMIEMMCGLFPDRDFYVYGPQGPPPRGASRAGGGGSSAT